MNHETREGYVFQRLFAKLDEEREALGGKVFDIHLPKLFPAFRAYQIPFRKKGFRVPVGPKRVLHLGFVLRCVCRFTNSGIELTTKHFSQD